MPIFIDAAFLFIFLSSVVHVHVVHNHDDHSHEAQLEKNAMIRNDKLTDAVQRSLSSPCPE